MKTRLLCLAIGAGLYHRQVRQAPAEALAAPTATPEAPKAPPAPAREALAGLQLTSAPSLEPGQVVIIGPGQLFAVGAPGQAPQPIGTCHSLVLVDAAPAVDP